MLFSFVFLVVTGAMQNAQISLSVAEVHISSLLAILRSPAWHSLRCTPRGFQLKKDFRNNISQEIILLRFSLSIPNVLESTLLKTLQYSLAPHFLQNNFWM